MCIFVQLNNNEERFVGSSGLGGNLSIYPHRLEKNSIFLKAQFSLSVANAIAFPLRGSCLCAPGRRPVTCDFPGGRPRGWGGALVIKRLLRGETGPVGSEMDRTGDLQLCDQ